MKLLRFALAVAGALMIQPVQADSPVVVELYTSQGCSSCPPADAMFRELAEREDVIALSMHVDYWDYIGWKDEFADPQHAARQRNYARVAGRRSIYTPQMIVNGQTDIEGAKPMKLSEALMAHSKKPSMSVDLARAGDQIAVSAQASGSASDYVVYSMRYQPLRQARITRGENAGHTLSYANVVEGLQIVGQWNGVTPLSMAFNAPGAAPVVVLIQDGPAGRIVGAAVLK
jgi:hypothetical protein